MADRGEVKPRQNRETNEILPRVSLDIGPILGFSQLPLQLEAQMSQSWPARIGPAPFYPIRSANRAASMDDLVLPNCVFHYPGREVFNLMRSC